MVETLGGYPMLSLIACTFSDACMKANPELAYNALGIIMGLSIFGPMIAIIAAIILERKPK